MKHLEKIRVFIFGNTTKIIGGFLAIGVPIFHNLHNIFFSHLANNNIAYYKNWYYFSLAVLHSLAPALGYLGFIPFLRGKTKGLVIVPFGYEIYKAIEKIPLQPKYTIYHEFWVASMFFMLGVGFLGWLLISFKAPNKQEKEQFNKYVDTVKDELKIK